VSAQLAGCLLVCLWVSLIGLIKPALAAEEGPAPAEIRAKSEFSQVYERAVAAYQARRYAAAIEDLLAAYKLKALPRLLCNIAQSYRRLGELHKAKEFFKQYLEADKAIALEMKGEIERYIVEIDEEEAAAKSSVATAPKLDVSLPAKNDVVSEPPSIHRLPRWQKALGTSLIVGGAGVLTAGIVFLALDGKCTEPPVAPAVACGFMYQSTAAGAAQTAVGSGLLIAGTLSLVIPYAMSSRSRSHMRK